MGDHTMSETEVSALKETLCAQQELLQKLYDELEAEREASASAVNEALSVILRLEGEKAVVKMEAEQYKRLAEEKICHAEESLSIFEDVIYQKDMEVAALDHQVQAYRYKLLSIGCTDPDHDNLLQTNENMMMEETSVKSIGRRRNSAPVPSEADLVSRIVEEKRGQEMCDQGSDSDKKTVNSYWEQMRKLDVRVKELAAGSSCMKCRRSVSSSDNLCSSIHDVFEVPCVDESCESVERRDEVHPEGDKMDWVKKVLQSAESESKLYQRSEFECNLVVVEAGIRTSEIVEEVERASSECCNREEEVRLLNEIKEKLDSLHEEIRGLKVKKSWTREEACSTMILKEAMLSFWL
ncbi:hypothetical protein ACS0TY_021525 [Phlomoides rotata]